MKTLLTFILFLSVSLLGASFDCAKATTKVEKMICADPELSALDENLSKTFKEALKATEDKEQLKKEQFAWMRERNLCKDNACTQKSYKSRITELKVFLRDDPKSESDVNLVHANIVNAYFKALCYHRSNALTYQVRYISAEEDTPVTKRCTFVNGETVYIDYSGDQPSERGECGATPELDFNLWIGNKRVISNELFTQRCNYESAIKSIKIQNNTITSCVYATTGKGITLKIDKNKISCSSKTIKTHSSRNKL